MIAIEIREFGGAEVLQPVERPKPEPGRGEVLIRVEAAGVSRADVMQREGKYPPPPGASDIPGLDVAGTVERMGADVSGWHEGDRVCAIVTGGGYAEFAVAPAPQVLPIPDHWTAAEAATLPENIFTSYDNLITRAGLRGGETALIHGGASGVGSMALMLACAWGATSIATAGCERKCEACRSFGAAHAIDYRKSDFVEETLNFTGGRGADVVMDLIGGAYLERNLQVLATEGRVSVVSVQGGRTGELNLGKLMQKRARIMGSTMRVRTPEQKGAVAAKLRKEVWPLLPEKRCIRPAIDRTFPLREARRAHERLESGQHIGKIVLVV